jgi:hypothetical protein
MTSMRFVASATLVAVLSVAVGPVSAQTRPAQTPAASTLRASIDRAAGKAAELPALPLRKPTPVRKAAMQGGGGGGMIVMSLIGTAVGLATTYFVIKEMRKQNEAATNPPQ